MAFVRCFLAIASFPLSCRIGALNEPTQGEDRQQNLPLTVVKGMGRGIASAGLGLVDFYHRYTLRIRAGERALAPTRRIRFSEQERRRISARQNNLCMYCGIALNKNNRQIDHIYPVEFGGENVDSNLQALCSPCNARKGVQTDADFRNRYREVLSGVRVGSPPATRIPQQRFREITQRTRQGETTRGLRQSVFRTSKQKIIAGSTLAGAVLGVAWFFAIAILFGDSNVGGQVALFGGFVVFGLVWIGSMWRAKRTGILDQ